mgnify:CR=1 FL=1
MLFPLPLSYATMSFFLTSDIGINDNIYVLHIILNILFPSKYL